MARWLLMMPLVAACSASEDDTLLAALDGTWSGGVVVGSGGPYKVDGTFAWDGTLLTGELVIDETSGTPPVADTHTYAVRRWTTDTEVHLDMTDVLDGTRGLDVDAVVGNKLEGEATVRYSCDAGTCGYEGEISMIKGTSTTSDTASR
ncbi:MAG: hypothetical protein ABMB14_01835 [Myxococcota bacterium]